MPIPVITDGIKAPEIPGPMDMWLRASQIKSLMTQNQGQELQNQRAQLEFGDEAKMRAAWQQSNGDPDQFINGMMKHGVSPKTVIGIQNALTEHQQKLATLDKDKLANSAAQGDATRGQIMSIVQSPPDQKQAMWQSAIQNAEQQGKLKPGAMTKTYPGDEVATSFANHFALGSVLAKEAIENKSAEGSQLRGQAAQQQANLATQEAPTKTAEMQARTQLTQNQNSQLGQVTPALKFQQQQENYRATLARQASMANELQKQGINNLQKQSDTYSQFLSTANSLKQSLAAAQNGNEMAAAVAPLQGTLFVTTAEGVKRINNTELQGVEGAGSLVQKINGALGKQTGKGPLSDALKQDMSKLVDLYQQSKYAVYKNQAGYTQRLHGLNPATTPILDPNGNIAGAPIQNQAGMAGNAAVKMKAPNGQIKPVPADQVEHYKSLGAQVVQ